MTANYGTPSLSNDAPDPGLSREQVVALFRDRDNEALRRHTGLVGTDGAGTYHVLCGCELSYSPEEWLVHLRAVVTSTRRFRPQQR